MLLNIEVWINVTGKQTELRLAAVSKRQEEKICIRTLVEVWKTWHANPIPVFFYQIEYCLYDNELSEDTAYFCAQWRRQKITELQKDYVILDGVEGRGPVAEIT